MRSFLGKLFEKSPITPKTESTVIHIPPVDSDPCTENSDKPKKTEFDSPGTPRLFSPREKISKLSEPSKSKTNDEAREIIEKIVEQQPETNHHASIIILEAVSMEIDLFKIFKEQDLLSMELVTFLKAQPNQLISLPKLFEFIHTKFTDIPDLYTYDLWFIGQAMSELKQSSKLSELLTSLKTGIIQSFNLLEHHRLQLTGFEQPKKLLQLPLPQHNNTLSKQRALEVTTKMLTNIIEAEKTALNEIAFYEHYLQSWSLPSNSEETKVEKTWDGILHASEIKTFKKIFTVIYGEIGQKREETSQLCQYLLDLFKELTAALFTQNFTEVNKILDLANKLLLKEKASNNSQDNNRIITIKDIYFLNSFMGLYSDWQAVQADIQKIFKNKDEIMQSKNNGVSLQSPSHNRFSVELGIINPTLDPWAFGFVSSFVAFIPSIDRCLKSIAISPNDSPTLAEKSLLAFRCLLEDILKILKHFEKFLPKISEKHRKENAEYYLRTSVLPFISFGETQENIAKVTMWKQTPSKEPEISLKAPTITM